MYNLCFLSVLWVVFLSRFSFSTLILLVGSTDLLKPSPYNLYCVGWDVKHCSTNPSCRYIQTYLWSKSKVVRNPVNKLDSKILLGRPAGLPKFAPTLSYCGPQVTAFTQFTLLFFSRHHTFFPQFMTAPHLNRSTLHLNWRKRSVVWLPHHTSFPKPHNTFSPINTGMM